MNNIFYFQYYPLSPFAPANDEAWRDYMYWQSLGGNPVESRPSQVNAYDDDEGSFNQWMLTGGPEGGMAVSPGEYQKYTQHSNPGAQYLAYDLFSGGVEGSTLGSSLFQRGNSNFWYPQLLNAMNRVPGSPIDNNMLRHFMFNYNSFPPNQINPLNPWANYLAFNAAPEIPTPAPAPAAMPAPMKRKKRSAEQKKRKKRSANRKRRAAGKR